MHSPELRSNQAKKVKTPVWVGGGGVVDLNVDVSI